MISLNTNTQWLNALDDVMISGQESAPRGQAIKEIIGHSYVVDMNNPIITLEKRKMNYGFMFGEAAWIVSGSNWLSDIAAHMKQIGRAHV